MFEFQTAMSELTGPAGLQRRPLRGPVVGRLGRLSGDRRDRAAPLRRLARRPSRTAARRSPPTRPGYGAEVVEVGLEGGLTDADALADAIDDETAAVFLQSPNFLGAVEDIAALARARPARPERWWSSPSTRSPLGVLRPPGECGADIAVGEGQPLGSRLDFGGPSFGFFCRDRGAHPPHAGPDRRRDRATSTGAAASSSRCRRASSTSAARRRPTTSAPRRRSTRSRA